MSKSVAQNDLENDDKNDDYIGPHQRMADAQDDVIDDVTKSIWGFLGFFVHNYRPWQLSRFKGSISSNWEGNFECDGGGSILRHIMSEYSTNCIWLYPQYNDLYCCDAGLGLGRKPYSRQILYFARNA